MILIHAPKHNADVDWNHTSLGANKKKSIMQKYFLQNRMENAESKKLLVVYSKELFEF